MYLLRVGDKVLGHDGNNLAWGQIEWHLNSSDNIQWL